MEYEIRTFEKHGRDDVCIRVIKCVISHSALEYLAENETANVFR